MECQVPHLGLSRFRPHPPRGPPLPSHVLSSDCYSWVCVSLSPPRSCLFGMAMDNKIECRKVCWNSKCGTSSSTTWRPGWIARNGRTAELCDYCGLVRECLSNLKLSNLLVLILSRRNRRFSHIAEIIFSISNLLTSHRRTSALDMHILNGFFFWFFGFLFFCFFSSIFCFSKVDFACDHLLRSD